MTPIDQKYHWGRAAIQVAFSIFVLTETWLVPIEGWFVDRFGPKIVVMIGGILVGIAWPLNSVADSLTMLYIVAAIGGIGAGAVYGTCIGDTLKWFPDRRGLAAGLTATGFGAGRLSKLARCRFRCADRADRGTTQEYPTLPRVALWPLARNRQPSSVLRFHGTPHPA